MQDDDLLLRRLQRGDETALCEILQRYSPYVMTIIRQISIPPLNEHDAEELASDVFCTLWKHAGSVRDSSALKAYLAQIARHAARRKRKQYRELCPLTDDILVSCAENENGDRLQRLTDEREQLDILNSTLKIMTPIRRSCLIRYYYYEQALSSIAAALTLPLSTVKSHVYRGREQLITALKEKGYEYEPQA